MGSIVGKLWSQWEKDQTRELWAQGLSASQIAKALNTGRSRNSVIGVIHRHGLSERRNERRSATRTVSKDHLHRIRPKRVRTFEASPPVLRVVATELPPIDPTLTIYGLTQFTCRYPIGDPDQPDFTYCGRTCDAERAFCVHHHALCYMADSAAKLERTRGVAEWAARKDKAGHYLAGMGA